MKTIYGVALLFGLFLISCNSESTLQKYFVENSENKNFIALDVFPKKLNVDETKLSMEQSNDLKSFDKINVLAFKLNDTNKAEFEKECAKVDLILKDKKYRQLMKFGSGKEGASVSFVGTDEHIGKETVYEKTY